jgi:hypothetical protein
MANPLVSSTFRRVPDSESRYSISPWLAQAPSMPIRILRR